MDAVAKSIARVNEVDESTALNIMNTSGWLVDGLIKNETARQKNLIHKNIVSLRGPYSNYDYTFEVATPSTPFRCIQLLFSWVGCLEYPKQT